MLKLVRCDDDARDEQVPDVLPFPVGVARHRGSRAEDLPFDGASLDAAFQVEQAMLDVEMNFLKLKKLLEDDDRPRAA